MPGTPPTSPNLGIARYADADTASFSSQVNAITDKVDALYPSGTLAARPAAGTFGRLYYATDTNEFYWDTGTAWAVGPRPNDRGATNIATSQSTSSATYTTLSTPDQVAGIVLPTNGLIVVCYQATWQESVSAASRAALFLGVSQLPLAITSGAPVLQAAAIGGSANTNVPLATTTIGLLSSAAGSGYTGDVTTGQILGAAGSGGPTYVFAAAGTYTVSVQFKTSSGTVTAANRKLWVQAIPFG